MDSRKISEIKTKYDGIICGFCLPYLSQTDSEKFIFDAYNLLNERGFIYISFVEDDPNKSDFITGSSRDRCYFYYHNLDKLKSQLLENSFEELIIFKVNYKISDTEQDVHTIVTARKKTITQQPFLCKAP